MRGSFHAVLLGLLALAVSASLSAAAELKVLSAGAVTQALKALAAEDDTANHDQVSLTFGNVGQIEDRLKAGAAADVVILSAPAIARLEKSGGAVPGTSVALGRVGMGVAVRAGAKLPDIATPEAFKAALLAAPSIAYSDPAGGGSSGIFFDQLIQRLGIADAIRKKAVLIRGGSAADQVASGKAAMSVQNLSELIAVPGVRVVGPFPAADQNYITYVAAVAPKSAEPQAARAFIHFITRSAAAKRWIAAGFEPAQAH